MTITAQALGLAEPLRDAPGAPGRKVPGYTGQGWSTHETMLVVRWLFAHSDVWDQAMDLARDPLSNPHTVADTLHEKLVPRSELDVIAAQGFDPAKVNWLEIAHELIERRDDPLPVQEHAGITISEQLIDLVGAEGYIHGYICVRPPCGEKPRAVKASDLSVRSDGLVVHKPSGWGIGQVTRDGHAYQAGHAADGSVTVHGAKTDAVKAVARKYNQGARPGVSAPGTSQAAPGPKAAARAPAAAPPPPSAVKTAPHSARPAPPPAVKTASKAVPGPVSAKVPPAARTASISTILAHPVGADVKKDVAPLFDGKYGDFTVKVDSAGMVSLAGTKDAKVQGTIYDKDGNKAGVVERDLFADRLGTQVDNTQMELYPKYQGQGFASEFYRQTEARLKAAGVRTANIHADLDVGGYAWARKGFDWRTSDEGKAKVESMAAWYKHQSHQDPAVAREIQSLLSRAQDPRSAQFPTPYDVSRVGYTPGATTWPGKQFMLAGEWFGKKNL